MTAESWRSRVRGAWTEDGRVRVFPALDVDGYADEELEAVRAAFAERLGGCVAIVRNVERSVDREARLLDVTYELEPLEPVSSAPEADGELAALLGGEIPPERAPWARRGWLAEATGWIESSLAGLGRTPSGPIAQVKTWPLSAVLRIPTADGLVYFKATSASPLFVDEGHVLDGLAALFPEVPKPLAFDSEHRWMLLDDLGSELGWDAPLEERGSVLEVFARMQVGSTRHDLLELGCIDRPLPWLERETRELLADDIALTGLEDEEIARLRALEPDLAALCRRLAAGPVPNALVHGDLHLSNVARVDGRYVFFDWTDACVTHPFLDAIDIHREQDAAARDRLREAYLLPWAGFASPERLLETWVLARPLCHLNQAVSYRHILANVEPGSAQQLEWATPHFLRLVLDTDFEALP